VQEKAIGQGVGADDGSARSKEGWLVAKGAMQLGWGELG
jgi:hypothetical protein